MASYNNLLSAAITWYLILLKAYYMTWFQGTVHLIIYWLHAKILVLEMKYNAGHLRNAVSVIYQYWSLANF